MPRATYFISIEHDLVFAEKSKISKMDAFEYLIKYVQANNGRQITQFTTADLASYIAERIAQDNNIELLEHKSNTTIKFSLKNKNYKNIYNHCSGIITTLSMFQIIVSNGNLHTVDLNGVDLTELRALIVVVLL